MKKSTWRLLGFLTGIIFIIGWDDAKTIWRYTQGLENKVGGFFSGKKGETKASLRATLGAVRIAKMDNIPLQNIEAHKKFVLSCKGTSGGFSDQPSGEPSLIMTAVGLMAYKDLEIKDEAGREGAANFLLNKAKNFEEIRMACAALAGEREGEKAREKWQELVLDHLRVIQKLPRSPQSARELAGVYVTLIRLKIDLPKGAAFSPEWRQKDGGFGSASSAQSDMDSVYRVGRFLYMSGNFKELENTMTFIAACKSPDGGFGPAPGMPSSMGSTYQARIVQEWAQSKK